MDKDKLVELARYDDNAKLHLLAGEKATVHSFGSSTMPHYLRAPYICYEQKVANLVNPHHRVLELGAGTGLHTWTLVQTGAQVTATDISPNSLKLLEQRIKNAGGNVATKIADMESLPFDDNSFDVVVCAGSLSYGEPTLVDAEIKRVLSTDGFLICVDSLNHNPIYRFNRWLHYLRGNRTRSTLHRMPDLSRIQKLSMGFEHAETRYFGGLTFVMPIIARLIGEQRAATISDSIDSVFSIQSSAFKFVLVAQNLKK
jgi:ubiquinone/menaquinone biosynthesis C-methylase UbiE